MKYLIITWLNGYTSFELAEEFRQLISQCPTLAASILRVEGL